MSYSSVEISAHGGEPVELYRFTSGLRTWLYTSGDVKVVYDTATYEPYPIRRGAFRQTQEFTKSGLEITTPRDTPIVTDALASPMVAPILLTIYRKHRSDAEVLQWWKGRVEGIRMARGEATISCSLLSTTLRRYGVRRPAQVQCPFALYDADCGALAAQYSQNGSLISYVGAAYTSGVFASQTNGWWVGGKIVFAGVPRLITGHVGDTITTTNGVPGLAQGAAFTVFPGCDHTPETCDTKFANSPNYGGASWWPIKNPFIGDSSF